MKLVTSKQMRELDRQAIEEHGIASLQLMENAGRGVAAVVLAEFPPKKGAVAIVAGQGNNGGDGLVVARRLIETGAAVEVFLLSATHELSPDARANFELLAPLTSRIHIVTDEPTLNSHLGALSQAGLIVDAIFGTGLARPVTGLAYAAIGLINSLGAPVISVDCPSGLSSDTGLPMGTAICADVTATLGLPKQGFFLRSGPDYAGRVRVVDIGIPPALVRSLDSNMELIEPSMFRQVFKRRRRTSHKGQYGHVAVFAGSRGHMGAGYLASLAALRSGCGLATYCLPSSAFARFDARFPEVMCEAIPDAGTAMFHPDGLFAALEIAKGKACAAIGPAIGECDAARAFVNSFIAKCASPLVIDADGLNCLDTGALAGRKRPAVLTPHPGEMARLAGVSKDEVQADRTGVAVKLAANSHSIVVLKGAGTVVAHPDGRAAINPMGNAGMATAGMGDALTGVIASFIAQGADGWTAAIAGVYVHGLAGDMAAREHGERALITSDVIKRLGDAMRELE